MHRVAIVFSFEEESLLAADVHAWCLNECLHLEVTNVDQIEEFASRADEEWIGFFMELGQRSDEMLVEVSKL